QYLYPSATQSLDHLHAHPAPPAGIAVQSLDTRLRQHRGQRLRQPLGAEALPHQSETVALVTAFRSGGTRATPVASQRTVAHVEGHADAAIAARDHDSAEMALQKVVKAAAV